MTFENSFKRYICHQAKFHSLLQEQFPYQITLCDGSAPLQDVKYERIILWRLIQASLLTCNLNLPDDHDWITLRAFFKACS